MDWKTFLAGYAPRDDLSEPFAAERFEIDTPALLNARPVLTAAAVGARVLEILALRGATRLKASSARRLRRLIGRALPTSAAHICDDEAARILGWLSELRVADSADPTDSNAAGPPNQADIVLDADIDSRISAAQFAIDETYDLELEYLDPREHIWPRIRCTPIEVIDAADHGGHAALAVRSDYGDQTIALRHIRWLMPVARHDHRRGHGPADTRPTGTLLQFPGDTDAPNGTDSPDDTDSPNDTDAPNDTDETPPDDA